MYAYMCTQTYLYAYIYVALFNKLLGNNDISVAMSTPRVQILASKLLSPLKGARRSELILGLGRESTNLEHLAALKCSKNDGTCRKKPKVSVKGPLYWSDWGQREHQDK